MEDSKNQKNLQTQEVYENGHHKNSDPEVSDLDPNSKSDNEDMENLKQDLNEGVVAGSLHVAELDIRVDEETIQRFFSTPKNCTVTSVKIVRDKFTKMSLGYAYVNFENEEQVSLFYLMIVHCRFVNFCLNRL